MAEKLYDWKRFWCTRETGYSLADRGFLSDPDSEFGRVLNPNAVAFSEISSKTCLALLGEPGIGKSYEVKTAQSAAESLLETTEDEVLPVDLSAYQTDTRLYTAIFDHPTFRKWVDGKHRLHLFLDSLDECLLRIQTVTALFEEELGRYPFERLVLRIACRTADWPISFERALQRFYGEENVGVYELIPLRRRDVEAALNSEGIDPKTFLKEVEGKNATPLANKPITLKMLINLFKRESAFPSRQADLYEKGCSLLCEEPNERRREVGLSGKFPVNVLLAAASRIAAVTVFGNRYAVWTDIDQGDVPPEDVTISQLAGGSENIDNQKVEITEDLIKETIGTGLFTSRGAHRMGWGHQTYAEFLAARYVAQTSMSQEQIMSLLAHPMDQQHKLVPQLHEAAAWVAGMNPEIFSHIIRSDPEVLLRSDVASFEPEDRKQLVQTLLMLYEQEKLIDRDIRKYYSKLGHPGLADQLRQYVREKTKNLMLRRAAVNIAEACEVREVLPELLAVALDSKEQLMIRKSAACAVGEIGDSKTKAQLKPLAFGELGADPNDDLKGCALRAVWSGHMTSQELFQALTLPKQQSYIGFYLMFIFDLCKSLPQQLKTEDFRSALDWIARGKAEAYEFESLAESIMIIAWEHLTEAPGLSETFAKAALRKLNKYEPIASGTKDKPFSETISGDHPRRRLVLLAALPVLDAAGGDLTHVAYSETPLVISDDLSWLIEQLKAQPKEKPKEKRRLWIKLIGLVFDYQKPGHLDLLLEARKKFPDLEKEFSWMNPLEIDSPAGRNMKARYLKHQRLEKRLEQSRKKPLLQPPPKERVLILLDKFERGDPNAWWQLNLEMTLEPNSRYYDFQRELEPDITALPVWQSADQKMRGRIVQAARQYVTSPPEMDNSWLGTNTFYRPASASYRALVLLIAANRTFVDELPEAVWKIWAPIIVAYPIDSFHDNEMHNCLLTMAYARAPEEVISALIAIIDRENREQEHLFITRRFEGCWDDRIASALFEKACSSDMKVSCVVTLFDLLIKHEYGPATEYAFSQVTVPLPAQDIQRERTLALAEALFANQPFESWEVIWPCIRDDIEFGRALLDKFAGSYRHDRVGEFTQKLTERQMADMYLWLETQYPQSEDPPHRGPIGTRHFLAEFRDGLLEQLKVRGTPKSCQQLTRIVNELPKLNWLKWVILEAEENTRRNTWEPPTPEHIIKLAEDSQRRYVENGEQLLELLCESLQRLQERLQGEMPAVNDLWDNRGNARHPEYCPKDEPHLSDYVARHLVQDLGPTRGIVVNREVQIRRGEQTDIHIDAFRLGIGGQLMSLVKAIIEVKGCWHPELETAMESQLVGRYLQDNQCSNGLYLVGWFMCDNWSDKDYRKNQIPDYSLNEARNHFAEKAEEISVNSTIPNLVLKPFVLDIALR